MLSFCADVGAAFFHPGFRLTSKFRELAYITKITLKRTNA
jgi:hypothetical protein